MNKPHFETWLQENLVKFCQDAYEKLCAQEQELQLLRLHTCSRRTTTREEKIVRPGVYDVCQCVMDEREACADAVRFADNGTEAAEIIRARGNT